MTMYTILGYRIACIALDCTFSVLLLYGLVGSNIMSSGDGESAPNISILNEYGTEIGWDGRIGSKQSFGRLWTLRVLLRWENFITGV